MLRRHLADELRASLADNPVTLLVGARQSGKSTLAQLLISEGHAGPYLTLDDAATLAAAASDPEGFVRGLSGNTVIDEVQRVPELMPAIKMSVDRDRRPGRLLLTGSANVLLLRRVSESLAGRMEVHTLWPFSQGEIDGHRETFLARLLGDGPAPSASARGGEDDIVERVLRGGFRLRSSASGSGATPGLQATSAPSCNGMSGISRTSSGSQSSRTCSRCSLHARPAFSTWQSSVAQRVCRIRRCSAT